MRVDYVSPQSRRGEDLHVVTPLQDPQPDLDGAGDGRTPEQGAVGVCVERLRRMPGRLANPVRDARYETELDLDRRLVGDDVPGRSQRGRRGRRIGWLERPRRQRHVPDPLDLEGP